MRYDVAVMITDPQSYAVLIEQLHEDNIEYDEEFDEDGTALINFTLEQKLI